MADWHKAHAREDEEKAAALDAAIEFEDSWPASEDQTSNIKNQTSEQGQGRLMNLIDAKDSEELNVAAAEVVAAKDRFRAICRKIGGPETASTHVPATVATETKPNGGQGRGRRKAAGPGKAAGMGKAAGDKPRWLPSQSIKCSLCGDVIEGVLQKGDKRYPYKHRRTQNGEPCEGHGFVGIEIGTGAEAATGRNPGAS